MSFSRPPLHSQQSGNGNSKRTVDPRTPRTPGGSLLNTNVAGGGGPGPRSGGSATPTSAASGSAFASASVVAASGSTSAVNTAATAATGTGAGAGTGTSPNTPSPRTPVPYPTANAQTSTPTPTTPTPHLFPRMSTGLSIDSPFGDTDSPPRAETPPPEGIHGDIELELLALANALYNLGTSAINDNTREKVGADGARPDKRIGMKV